MLRDWGKLLGLVAALVSITALLITDHLDPVAGAGLIGTIVGYMTGNGQNAVTGAAPSPVFTPTNRKVYDLALEAAEAARQAAWDAGLTGRPLDPELGEGQAIRDAYDAGVAEHQRRLSARGGQVA